MCRLVRCTVRRAAPWREMRTRVLAERRTRDAFFSMLIASLLLRFLERHLLARVPHALALVGLRRLVRADLGGHLADALAIDALDDDFRLRRRPPLPPFRQAVPAPR